MLFVCAISILLICTIPPTTSSSALYLTPYIYKNQTEQARSLSAVNSSLFLNVTSYSGFLTVDEKYNSNTFFWYFPVEGKQVNDTPWIIWLQGGPGGSSLDGLFDEMGPFEYDGELKLRNSTWCKEFSMVFLDNPVGAGFSFTDSKDGFVKDMATYTEHLYVALEQLVTLYPELKTAPLVIAGESYAGRYVPALAEKILDSKKMIGNVGVNLLGIMMGNPSLNREDIADFTGLFYRWGLIDAQGVQAAKPCQDKYFKAIKSKNATAARDAFDTLLDKLQYMSDQNSLYNVLKTYNLKKFETFLAKPEIKDAIHVGTIKFTFSNQTVHTYLVPDFLSEIETKITKVLEHYKVLIYCGQLDLTTPCVPNAEARRKKWHWSGRQEFLKAPRLPWAYNGEDVGFVKQGGLFTEVLLTGSGHLAPIDKPYEVQQLITYFIKGYNLPTPVNYKSQPEYTPEYKDENDKIDDNDKKVPEQIIETKFGIDGSLIVSLAANVVLVIIVISGIFYYVRRKRRTDFFYSSVDNISDEIFMS